MEVDELLAIAVRLCGFLSAHCGRRCPGRRAVNRDQAAKLRDQAATRDQASTLNRENAVTLGRQPRSNSSFPIHRRTNSEDNLTATCVSNDLPRQPVSVVRDYFNRVHRHACLEFLKPPAVTKMHPFSRVSHFSISPSTSRRAETLCPSFI